MSTANAPTPTARSLASQPVAWLVALFGAGVVLALSSSDSNNPLGRLGLAFLIGGVAVAGAWGVERRVWPLGVGGFSLLSGVLLLWDPGRFLTLVRSGLVVAAVGAGLIVVRLLRRRGAGALTQIVTMAVVVAMGALMFVFDRQLLSLSIGLVGILIVMLSIFGISRALRIGSPSTWTFSQIIRLSGGFVIERTAGGAGTHPIHQKVLFEGPDRRARFGRFLMLMGFASAIAALGIVADSTAVVIGAMLIAPLLTPLMGMSLSLIMGWAGPLRRAGVVAGTGMAVSVAVGYVVSAIIGMGIEVSTNTQIVSRTSPTLVDLGIALAAGAAGAYALSRQDVSDALPGVAVAIALVPPLAVVGVTAQLGEWALSAGSAILFVTNALAILLMGAATFYLTGIAATETDRAWNLDGWVAGLAAVGVVVMAALLFNTSLIAEAGAQTEIAEGVVDTWIADREYDVLAVEVEDSVVTVVLTGDVLPDDSGDLADDLDEALRTSLTLDLRVALTERTVIEPGTGE